MIGVRLAVLQFQQTASNNSFTVSPNFKSFLPRICSRFAAELRVVISRPVTTLATIMVTFYSEIAYPLVTVFYWAKHNPKDIFESTLDLCTL